MRRLTVILLSILLLVSSVLVYKAFFSREIVYADIGKLVEGYKLKKDLEEKLEADLLIIKGAVDSLTMVNKVAHSAQIDSNIIRLEREFSEYYNKANQQISNEVWNRLNPAIELFGKEKHYKLIVGANGAGTVLYGDSSCDVTNELIAFVNHLYEKGN